MATEATVQVHNIYSRPGKKITVVLQAGPRTYEEMS